MLAYHFCMRRSYQVLISCAYIALVALIVWVLKMPLVWGIALLVIAGACVVSSMSTGRESASGNTFLLGEDYKDTL